MAQLTNPTCQALDRTLRARVNLALMLPLASVLTFAGCAAQGAATNENELDDPPIEAVKVVAGLASSDDDASLASLNPEFFGGDSSASAVRVRKNVSNLTNAERKDYVDAVLKLKKTRSPYDRSLSYYDQFVAWHVTLNLCEFGQPFPIQMGHGSPIFLPWHRVFTLLFETALRQVSGKSITVPYWDWATTADHDKSVVFATDFMGGAGDPMQNYAVTTGAFRKGKWKLNIDPPGTRWAAFTTDYLTRYLGDVPFPLPTSDDVALALGTAVYDVAPWDNSSASYGQSFRNTLEGNRGDGPPNPMTCTEDGTMPLPFNGSALHNGIHAWVGGPFNNGTMVLPTSPNDPVFFLHHSQIDRLWAKWQETHGVNSYKPVSGVPGNNVNDIMMPYDSSGIRVTPAKVADIRKLGYRYQ